MNKEQATEIGDKGEAPAWPAEIVEKIKADFLEELNREHDGPCRAIGTTSELGPLVTSLVVGYAESHPAIAHYEYEIANVLYAMVEIKR